MRDRLRSFPCARVSRGVCVVHDQGLKAGIVEVFPMVRTIDLRRRKVVNSGNSSFPPGECGIGLHIWLLVVHGAVLGTALYPLFFSLAPLTLAPLQIDFEP